MTRGYSIVRVWANTFLNQLRQLYRENPWLLDAPFEEHRRFFFSQRYLHGDAFAREFGRMGHAAEEIVYNMLRLQGAWAREHGLPWDPVGTGQYELFNRALIAQIRAIRPDVVYVQSVNAYPPGLWREVRAACPSVRLVVGYLGYTPTPERIEGIDFLFVNLPALARQPGFPDIPHEVLPHAFDAAPDDDCGGARDHAFTFVGSSGFGSSDYDLRRAYLTSLMAGAGLECWLSEEPVKPSNDGLWEAAAAAARATMATRPPEEAARVLRERSLGDLAHLPLGALFPERRHAPAYGRDMRRILGGSRMTFNIHSAAAGGEVGNMRMFEATGLGSCLVTDHGANIAELFEPDAEIVVYRSIEECMEKVLHLRDHEEDRRRIAEAGRRRTLRDHTYANRCAQIDARIQALLAR